MGKRKLGKAAERARAERRKRQARTQGIISFVKDIAVALLIVAIVMASLYAYSGGIWPPMVVVESESMMHGSDSHIGTIDTGDLTLVKKVSSKSDIITYVEGRPSYNASYQVPGQATKAETFKGSHSGFMNYDDYGNVIIYEKNGRSSETPVIHRAIVWFVPNTTASCVSKLPMGYYGAGDFPDVKNAAHPEGLKCVETLVLHNVGYGHDQMTIESNLMLQNEHGIGSTFFAGFITHGDHNYAGQGELWCDQKSLGDNLGRPLAPNKVEWLVGKAVGELPWFGALKLVASGTPSKNIPPSSWKGLIATIVLIIVIPFILDIAIAQYQKRKAKKAGKKDDEEEDEEDEEPEDEKEEDEEEEEADEDVDLDDEYEDEFKDMAASKPEAPAKKNRR